MSYEVTENIITVARINTIDDLVDAFTKILAKHIRYHLFGNQTHKKNAYLPISVCMYQVELCMILNIYSSGSYRVESSIL